MATDWDRIVREHGPMVYGTAWRILGNAADAEDVVQDVFLQIHQLQQTHPVRCWVALLRGWRPAALSTVCGSAARP